MILKVVTIIQASGFTYKYNIISFFITLLKKVPEAILSATETHKITFPLFLLLETKCIELKLSFKIQVTEQKSYETA